MHATRAAVEEGIVDVVISYRQPPTVGEPGGTRHHLRRDLVHVEGGAEHTGAHVGRVGELQQSLHRAVFAPWPVEDGQHHQRLADVDRCHRGLRREVRTFGIQRRGELATPGGEGGHGGIGPPPATIGRDRDRAHLVAVRVHRPQDVGGRDSGHVVFGGLASVEEDQADPGGRVGHGRRA
jgi:hypothetical protein